MGKLNRIVLAGLLSLAGYYALFGGEYSVFEMRATRASIEVEARELAEMRREMDSLRTRADSLEIDSAVLERVARERFGMIRKGEVLYRFAPPREEDDSLPNDEGDPAG